MTSLLNLSIWVTSNCNLNCKLCAAQYTMQMNKGYDMPIEEVRNIVDSCKRRNMHFDIIDLTGGEPSLWSNLEQGVRLFKEISDEVSLTTNGNNPELIIGLGLKWIVLSTSQADEKQIRKYEESGLKLFCNAYRHRKVPSQPILGSIPAICTNGLYPDGRPQNKTMYIRGKVYYCCSVFNLSNKVPIDDKLICDFEDDFLSKFNNKKCDNEICAYCLCNSKVWDATE